MKAIKKMLILISIIVVILIVLLVLLNRTNKTEQDYIDESNIQIDYKVSKVTNSTKFYTVENCIQTYLNKIYLKDSDAVYNILDDEYISSQNITKTNVLNKVYSISKRPEFTAIKMNILEGENIESYSIYGTVSSIEGEELGTPVYFKLKLDTTNFAFCVTPILEITDISQIKLEKLTNTIKKNEDNTFSYYRIKDADVVRKYFAYYRKNVNNNIESAYELLDSEYREKRFNNVKNYENYIEEISQDFKTSILQEYSVEKETGYKNYIVKDQYNNLYIFKETAVMEYTITLDTYTLEQETFNTEYSQASNEKKVMMNIDKFFQMINAKDYTAAYACLADSFKSNYFKTEEKFKQYVKSNLYKYNEVTYNVFNDQVSGIYQYSLTLKDITNSSNQKAFNIVMKLNSGTDFEMSFEV